MKLFPRRSTLCITLMMSGLIAAPAAVAALPGPADNGGPAGQQLVSDITILTGLNRMRLTRGQMRDIEERLSQLSYAEKTYARHETDSSQPALEAMRRVEKALQTGQEVDAAAQAKVDAVLNPLKVEAAKVEQLRDETVDAIALELRPEQLSSLLDTLGIHAQPRAAWNPAVLEDGARLGDGIDPNLPRGPYVETPQAGDTVLPLPLGEVGQPLANVTPQPATPGPEVREDGLTPAPPAATAPAVPQDPATPPAARAGTPGPRATTKPVAPAAEDGGVPAVPVAVLDTTRMAPTDGLRVTYAAAPIQYTTDVELTEEAPANPPAPETQEDEGQLEGQAEPGDQEKQIANLEAQLQKLNAQTMHELQMIQKTMAQLRIGQAQRRGWRQQRMVMGGMAEPPQEIVLDGAQTGTTYPPGRGDQSVYRDAVRRFFLQPSVLRFLRDRLANQE
ncbi:MAG TPA: hypothetical protein VFJ58_07315 [Armatimonadota bacterium]|nr:hypothetical protein [Armatimonadota bacterium]